MASELSKLENRKKILIYTFMYGKEVNMIKSQLIFNRMTYPNADFLVIDDHYAQAEGLKEWCKDNGFFYTKSMVPRNGNLRGNDWLNEQYKTLLENGAREYKVVLKCDPDTLIVNSKWIDDFYDSDFLIGGVFMGKITYMCGHCYIMKSECLNFIREDLLRLPPTVDCCEDYETISRVIRYCEFDNSRLLNYGKSRFLNTDIILGYEYDLGAINSSVFTWCTGYNLGQYNRTTQDEKAMFFNKFIDWRMKNIVKKVEEPVIEEEANNKEH